MRFHIDSCALFLQFFSTYADKAVFTGEFDGLDVERADVFARFAVITNMDKTDTKIGRVYELEATLTDGKQLNRAFTLYTDEVEEENPTHLGFTVMYQIFDGIEETLVEFISYRIALDEDRVLKGEFASMIASAADALMLPLQDFLLRGKIENLENCGFELVADDLGDREEQPNQD
jgi:hypothetical protein